MNTAKRAEHLARLIEEEITPEVLRAKRHLEALGTTQNHAYKVQADSLLNMARMALEEAAGYIKEIT